MNFEFDAWARLARENPREFERQRRVALRAAIEQASPEHRERLAAIQYRIDREREPDPPASWGRINYLMWAGFARLRKELSKRSSAAEPGVAAPPDAGAPAPITTARVIPLRPYLRERRIARRTE